MHGVAEGDHLLFDILARGERLVGDVEHETIRPSLFLQMRGYLTQAFDEVFAVFGIEGGMVGGIVGPFARVGVFAEVRRGRPRPAESSRPERQVEVGEFELVQIIFGLFVELFEVGDGLAVFKLEGYSRRNGVGAEFFGLQIFRGLAVGVVFVLRAGG